MHDALLAVTVTCTILLSSFMYFVSVSLCISGCGLRHDTWCRGNRHHTKKSQMPPSSRVGCRLSSGASPGRIVLAVSLRHWRRLARRHGSAIVLAVSSRHWRRLARRHGSAIVLAVSFRSRPRCVFVLTSNRACLHVKTVITRYTDHSGH